MKAKNTENLLTAKSMLENLIKIAKKQNPEEILLFNSMIYSKMVVI